jgi:hypothetical protein
LMMLQLVIQVQGNLQVHHLLLAPYLHRQCTTEMLEL